MNAKKNIAVFGIKKNMVQYSAIPEHSQKKLSFAYKIFKHFDSKKINFIFKTQNN